MEYSIFGEIKSSISYQFLSNYINKYYWNNLFLKLFELDINLNNNLDNSLFLGLVDKTNLFLKTSNDTISIFDSPFHISTNAFQTVILFSKNKVEKSDINISKDKIKQFLLNNNINYKNIIIHDIPSYNINYTIQSAFSVQLNV